MVKSKEIYHNQNQNDFHSTRDIQAAMNRTYNVQHVTEGKMVPMAT